MRKFIAALLLCAFFVQSSMCAQGATQGDVIYASSNGVRADVAAQIAATFIASINSAPLVLGAIAVPGSSQTMATPSNWTPPAAPMTLAPKPVPPTAEQLKAGAHLVRPYYPRESGSLGTPPAPAGWPFKHLAPMAERQNSSYASTSPTPRGGMHLGARALLSVNTAVPSTTGLKPWWTFEGGTFTGVGSYSVNVASGNLIAESPDIDVAERGGLDLSFTRYYDSQSQHDTAMSDGSMQPANFGNGWTNSYDAHVAPNSQGGMSLWDETGARWDYVANGTNCPTPPAGQPATLCKYGQYWDWMLTDGMQIMFFEDYTADSQPQYAAYSGRLYGICTRNYNNCVYFKYYWANQDTGANPNNLNKIVAQHTDGHALTLNFTLINGQRLLTSLDRPDNVLSNSISYGYDANNNLTHVYEPANNNAQRLQYYGYYSNSHQLYIVQSPRVTTAPWDSDGGWNWISYYANNAVEDVFHSGFMNPTPSDGTGQALQSGPSTGDAIDWWNTFTYNTSGSLWTHLTDCDGHQRYWYFDSNGIAGGRVGATYDYTGSQWLTTAASYDGNNNVTATIEPRGFAAGNTAAAYETDYGYDASGTNLLWVAKPQVTTASGTFRPTSRLAYDQWGNVTALCDPIWNHLHGADFGGTNACTGTPSGTTQYTYDHSDSNEPWGRLATTTSPTGYTTTLTYAPSPQDSLPLTITGASFSQLTGAITPTATLTYDVYGNVLSVNNGQGITTITYDALNQPTTTADPDPGHPTSCVWYYPDGSVSATESATEYAYVPNGQCSNIYGNGPGQAAERFTYDADGNTISETTHFGYQDPVAGTKHFFYDGADRLVEVEQPQDSAHDAFAFPWMSRYIYDLTKQNGLVSINGGTFGSASFNAHGNLYKVQKYIGGPIYTGLNGGSPSWQDVSGNAYDELDRPTTRYNFQPGKNLVQWNYLYDTAPVGVSPSIASPGFMTSVTSPLGDVEAAIYDTLGQVTNINYVLGSSATPSITTPNRQMSYDADGRIAQVSSIDLGSMSYQYNADGNLTQSSENLGGVGIPEFTGSGAWNSQTILDYSYYPNGWRSSLGVRSTLLNQSAVLGQTNFEQDSYRADGLPSARTYNYGSTSYPFAWKYSPAGRLLSKIDPNSGVALTANYDNYGRLQSYGLPEGTYANLSYDAEGEMLGYTFTASPSNAATTVRLTYSNRGELVGNGAQTNKSADGFMYSGSTAQCYYTNAKATVQSCGTSVPTFDARMDANLGTNFTPNPGQPPVSGAFLPRNILYDASMRMFATTSHDIDNHDMSQNGYNVAQGTYTSGLSAWGPNGHPTVTRFTPVNGVSTDRYAHWNGDQVLYTTTAQGAIDDVKLGSEGDLLVNDPNGLSLWDRDFTGVAIANRNSSGHGDVSMWTAGGTCTNQLATVTAATSGYSPPRADASTCNTQGQLLQPRTDGYYNGTEFINGVRGYSSAAGSWTSPDALGGGQPFAYANNNAMEFSDPSGYCGTGGWWTGSTLGDGPTAWKHTDDNPCDNWGNFPFTPDGVSFIGGGRPGALWLPCGKDYDSSGDACPHGEIFAKVEGDGLFGFASGSFTVVCGGAVFSPGAGGGLSVTPANGSLALGMIFPNGNNTARDVALGPTGSVDVGYWAGFTYFSNKSGYGVALTLTTPTLSGGGSVGIPMGKGPQCKK